MRPEVRFHIRDHDRPSGIAIGPGKIALLEAIRDTGSITSAAKALGMSYRRAWLLVDETNRCLRRPAVATAAGGRRGGGTALTEEGAELVRRYRAVERATADAVSRRFATLFRARPIAAARAR